MTVALTLAERGLGQVWPNPAVGCVLVRAGRMVGRGWTQPGGRPHAETEALRRAGAAARGATAYVTLEPCSHHGETAPCADALIAAGISRCVVACRDSDPRVAGRGLEKLRQAGVEVTFGLLEEPARALNAGFFLQREKGRPLVTLKLATTLDGMIATHAGHSKWVVLDCRLRLPLTHDLVSRAAQRPTLLITRKDAPRERMQLYRDAGVEVVHCAPDQTGSLRLSEVLALLGARGVTQLLVEGGAHLAAALLRDGLVDRLYWFRAAKVIGGDGHPAAMGFGVSQLDQAASFRRLSLEYLGNDLLETFAFFG